MRKVEILAPAGSYESLCGAINGGCDAVYLGGNRFGARAFAENFDRETMLRAIDYVHMFDKKIYLTVNTLLQNEEIEEELFAYLEPFYKQGLDAVIVQDVGVLSFIHRNFPDLPLHASTQMTFTTEQGGEFLKKYGVTRFVTSRELSAAEITNMRKRTDLEIETFVHGALCYCYSGQCFMSSMIGGRSGNRGRCAQPCRMPYKVETAQGEKVKTAPYVLSPKDICTLDKIPELVDAGIDSFKIEGRMKKPEYAAYTSYLYRKYTDLYLEYGEDYFSYMKKHKKELEYDYTCLMDLYNRGGFSDGYFFKENGPSMMSMVRPNHSGVLVGTVERVKKNRVGIRLEQDLYAQDVLEFRKENGQVLYEYTVKENVSAKKEKYTETNTKPGSNILVGTKVFRTRRNALLKEIQEEILQKQRKIPVRFLLDVKQGEPLKLSISQKNCTAVVYGEVVEGAKSQPITKEKIQKQLGKLNTTIFQMEDCQIKMEEKVFIPVGQLNEIRRNGLAALEEKIVEQYKRAAVKESVCPKQPGEAEYKGIVVSVQTKEQAMAAAQIEAVAEIFYDLGSMDEEDILDILRLSNKKCYLMFPAIIREKEYLAYADALQSVYKEKKCESILEKILSCEQVAGFVLKNYESVMLFKKWIAPYTDKQGRLDYNMYTCNREAKIFWQENGIEHSTASIELNGAEWKRNGCQGQDIMVYGRPAIMTSAQCVYKNTKHCIKKQTRLLLQDKFEKEYWSFNRCKFCYNQIYETKPISLHEYMDEILSCKPEHIRIDLLTESKQESEQLIKYYADILNKREVVKCPVSSYHTGHFRKGVK